MLFSFFGQGDYNFLRGDIKIEKQTKHDTEHRNYLTLFCRPFQESGLESADENMFAFSFAMTFDNAGNISNSCKNILQALTFFFHSLDRRR